MIATYKGLDNRLKFLGFLLTDITAIIIVSLVLHQIVSLFTDLILTFILAFCARKLRNRSNNYFLTLGTFLAIPKILGVKTLDNIPIYHEKN